MRQFTLRQYPFPIIATVTNTYPSYKNFSTTPPPPTQGINFMHQSYRALTKVICLTFSLSLEVENLMMTLPTKINKGHNTQLLASFQPLTVQYPGRYQLATPYVHVPCCSTFTRIQLSSESSSSKSAKPSLHSQSVTIKSQYVLRYRTRN